MAVLFPAHHIMTDKPHVIIYTRPGCHLCEEAKQEIFAAGCHDEFTFEEINIDTDSSLARLHGLDVPVVTVNGIVTFKHRLTAVEFKRQLRNRLPA